MQEDLLIRISNKIKEIRKQKKITVEGLANKADVSKGLISQIENNRTVPSLLVLMNIIQSLNLDLKEFFKDVESPKRTSQRVLVKRQKDYVPFEKESARGFVYKRICTQNLQGAPVDIVLLELKKGARRAKPVRTDAFEYKYVIKGKIEYYIGDKKYALQEGDSIFFDGRVDHMPANTGNSGALLLVVYFFFSDGKK